MMKKYFIFFFALVFPPPLGADFSAHAEETTAEIKIEETSPKIGILQEEKNSSEISPPPIEVDFITLESAGTMSNVREGALGKGLWKGQKRSEILALLERLPARHEMLNMHRLKKNLLLSTTTASLIKNDTPPEPGHDLLTIRLTKLIEAGLYDDAYNLYTQNVTDPYHDKLAQIGILLIIYEGELPTACLEEKVLSKRYKNSPFWDLLHDICSHELSAPEEQDIEETFTDSQILKALYSSKGYTVSSQDLETLIGMSLLERAIVFARHKVIYDNFKIEPDALSKISSALLMLFIKDKSLPEPLSLPLQKEAIRRGLLSPNILKKTDENYKRISTLEPGPEQWNALLEVLSTESSPDSLIILSPYLDFIQDNKPKSVDQKNLSKIIRLMLLNDVPPPPFWEKKMMEIAENFPENYVYLQALKALGSNTIKEDLPLEKLTEGVASLGGEEAEQALAIIETLDKKKLFDDNPQEFYEKHSALTLEGYYVMPSVSLTKQIKTAKKEQQTGLVVLMLLNVLHDKPERVYPETLRETLGSLQAVGLIEDARRVAKESLASIIKNNKGE